MNVLCSTVLGVYEKVCILFLLKTEWIFGQYNNSTCVDSALYVKNDRHLHAHAHTHTLFLCAGPAAGFFTQTHSAPLCRLGASHPHQQYQGLCASPAREEHRAMSLHLNIWDFLVSQHDPNHRSPGPSVLMPSQPSAWHWTRAAWTSWTSSVFLPVGYSEGDLTLAGGLNF